MSSGELNQREQYWQNFEAGTTPTSAQLHPEYLASLNSDDMILDIGACSGRLSREIVASTGGKVVGIDINVSELVLGASRSDGATGFVAASAESLPFENDIFDGGILVGVLAAVNRQRRKQFLVEAFRVLKPGSSIFVSEFERVEDDEEWTERYQHDADITGEYGNVIVPDYTDPNLPISFIGHHFEQQELDKLLHAAGFIGTVFRRLPLDTRDESGFGYLYSNICSWATKP